MELMTTSRTQSRESQTGAQNSKYSLSVLWLAAYHAVKYTQKNGLCSHKNYGCVLSFSLSIFAYIIET